MNITIDGSKLTTKITLFEELRKQIQSNEFHGNNLDALYEVLSGINEDVYVLINNYEDLQSNLGSYSDSFLTLLQDLQQEISLQLEIK